MTSFYSKEEAEGLGFKCLGKNALISRKASFYGVSRISIGNNVRIDDFTVLSAGAGGIKIGNYVHISVSSSLIGEGAITLGDYSGISSRVAIFSSNDDYSGKFMTNPTVPKELTGVVHADVKICRHVIIGAGSVILPGVTLNEGAAVGALSLIHKDCEAFFIYAGNPAKKLLRRRRDLLELEKKIPKAL